MNIYGIKHLDKNEYNSITIDKDVITISGEIKTDTMKKGIPFSESLKGLDNDGKVDQVIDYFLRNNRITFINDCGYCTVVGNEDRLLRSKIELSNENRYRLFERYLSNRSEALKKIKVDTYTIEETTKMSAYSVILGETMRLVLATKNQRYLDFEKRFLDELLDRTFSSEVEIQTLYHKDKDGNDTKELDGIFIVGEHPRGCRIRIYRVNEDITNAIENHNTRIRKEKEESETAKIMQLKLEGF